MEEQGTVIMYGTTWCPDCLRSKRFLERHAVPYEWVNIEEVPAAGALVRSLNRGMQVVPTIVLPDGLILAEPSDRALAQALGLAER